MSLKACLDPYASNYLYDANGNYSPDAMVHIQSICEYTPGMHMDEETMAQSIGSEDYMTHEEAEAKGSGTDLTSTAQQTAASSNKTLTSVAVIGLLLWLL